MPTLCNKVTDAIVQRFQLKNKLLHMVGRVYKNTLPGSPLRKLAVATWVQHQRTLEQLSDEHNAELLACPEFVLDLAKGYAVRGTRPKKCRIPDPCQYHQQGKGEKKCT